MTFIKGLLGKLSGFLTNTGLVWFGYLGGAIAAFFILGADTWFAGVVFGVLIGAFIFKNLEDIKAWAGDKIEDIKDKF